MKNRIAWASLCGLVVGWIAYMLGTFVPMLLWPESNIAPILGILVTGPLGFILGAAFGAIFAKQLNARLLKRRQ